MAHHLDGFRSRQFKGTHPEHTFVPLSEFARSIA